MLRLIRACRARSFALAAVFAACAYVAVTAQDDAAVQAARIEAPQAGVTRDLAGVSIPELLQKANVPGVSVAVIKDSTIHFARGYGFADAATSRRVDAATLFQAASISKPVTAMATVRLAQEGRLSLDADISTLVRSWQMPKPHAAWPAVTPRSLSSHTSGADDGFGFPGYDPSAPRPSLVQILKGTAPSNVGPVLFTRPAYQAYKYSGGSVTLMQLALTDVTGRGSPS